MRVHLWVGSFVFAASIACGGANLDSSPPSFPPDVSTDAGLVEADAGVNEADTGVEDDAGQSEDGGFDLDMGTLDAGVTEPTFVETIAPILKAQCQGCHGGPRTLPRIVIDESSNQATYNRLVDVPALRSPLDYIEPGDSDASYLLHKIEGTHRDVGGAGNFMPPPVSRRRVPAEEVERIRAWIDNGAPF